MKNSVWKTLSQINVNEHTEVKGNFTYLSWSWAWATLMEHYPQSTYTIEEDMTFPDGTMEVRVSLTVEGVTHTMFLPVLDHRNKPIPTPNAFDVNTARMRCLVKAMALFGLGHYIYAGSDLPVSVGPLYTEEQKDEFYGLIAQNDGYGLKEFHAKVGHDVMDALFNSAPHGQKTAVKDKCRKAVNDANKAMKETVDTIQEALMDNRTEFVVEVIEEMPELEYKFVRGAMDEIMILQVDQIMQEVA